MATTASEKNIIRSMEILAASGDVERPSAPAGSGVDLPPLTGASVATRYPRCCPLASQGLSHNPALVSPGIGHKPCCGSSSGGTDTGARRGGVDPSEDALRVGQVGPRDA